MLNNSITVYYMIQYYIEYMIYNKIILKIRVPIGTFIIYYEM